MTLKHEQKNESKTNRSGDRTEQQRANSARRWHKSRNNDKKEYIPKLLALHTVSKTRIHLLRSWID